MAARRKKSDMALLSQDTFSTGQEQSAPDRPPNGPRRSGRLLDKSGEALYSQPADARSYRQSDPGRTRVKRKIEWSEGTKVAVNALQKMEEGFRDDVKKQKTALKESEPKSEPPDLAHAAFMPRLTKAQPDVLPAGTETEVMKRRAAMQEDDAEYTAVGGEGDGQISAPREDLDLAVNETDLNAIKQEGSRPPPVNSDYLPLPWKGRLGYVNNTCHLSQGAAHDESLLANSHIGLPKHVSSKQ